MRNKDQNGPGKGEWWTAVGRRKERWGQGGLRAGLMQGDTVCVYVGPVQTRLPLCMWESPSNNTRLCYDLSYLVNSQASSEDGRHRSMAVTIVSLLLYGIQ